MGVKRTHVSGSITKIGAEEII